MLNQKVSRDLFASTLFMSEEPDPPWLRLGDIWPDDRKDSDLHSPRLMSARRAKLLDRPQCSVCAGELVRSRIRLYERILTVFTSARPYRCLDCRMRRWR
jgi:hypothetical protein